jgi:type I restriction enzyme, S subunit
LGRLDDKIELNRQMNQTLEAMAQALFKSWFVDFDPVLDNALAAGNEIPEALHAMAQKRKAVPAEKKLVHTNPELAKEFPSAFVFNEKLDKWIPEGWEVRKLADEINLIGGGTPKTSIEAYWNGNIPWFSVVDAPSDSDVFVIETEKKISEVGVQNSSTKILREGTTIISARGTVGKCAVVGVPMAMNQSCYGIQGINENEDNYTYLVVRKNVADLQNKSHGSVFSTITRDTFSAIEIVLPTNRGVVQEFEMLVKSSFNKIKSNLLENRTLTQLRDTLLPQLISGKLKVPEGVVMT